jgi:2-hydroxy-3-oxopropionate reductase
VAPLDENTRAPPGHRAWAAQDPRKGTNMKIGFIGLGIMGKPMAKNLLKAGHEIVCFDIVKENVDNVVAAGAKAAASCKAVAEQCPLIITMLPNSPHVKEAVLGPGGVLEGAKAGTILIDMSSIAPGASQEIAQACAARGVKMIDAPVSGGEPKAIDGTLSIMVGGDPAVFESVKDILLKMGASAVHCGPIGAGNTTKLANQIIVACNIAAVAEAFTLARKAGVDPKLVFDAIKGGLAGSTVMNAKLPMILEGNFKPGFKIDLHIKDLANALDTGHAVGSPLPLTAAVMEMMQTLRADDCGQNDHSALAKYYAKLSGTRIGK